MAIDLAALRARIAAQRAATTPAPVEGVSNETSNKATDNVVAGSGTNTPSSLVSGSISGTSAEVIPIVNAPAVLGTSKTTEIDHLDFLAKMNSLAEAIHKQHPTMPVLLMQIHKHLRSDPELVTTLDEDAIGIIVKGLQVQTKTEILAEVVKKASNPRTKKNAALDTSMF